MDDEKIIHRYSPSAKTWYPSNIEYPDLPTDLIDSTDDQWLAYLKDTSSTITVKGKKLVVGPPPPLDTSRTWDQVRSKRNYLLADCDFTQLPDYPGKDKDAWNKYRQALRDLPTKFGDSNKVTWPTSPSATPTK
jgi:hypothetical protein